MESTVRTMPGRMSASEGASPIRTAPLTRGGETRPSNCELVGVETAAPPPLVAAGSAIRRGGGVQYGSIRHGNPRWGHRRADDYEFFYRVHLIGAARKPNGSHKTSPLEEAVSSEPVSEAKFPASWENTGNFVLLGLRVRLLVRNQWPNSMVYDPIPYASEQGI
jgi:hypothetical protein